MSREHNLQLQKEWFARKYADPAWKADRNYQRAQLRRDNKRKLVIHFNEICYDCKQTYPDCVFEFHHVDENLDKDRPSRVLHCSWSTIMRKLGGCLMFCANCHRMRHLQLDYEHHKKRYV